MDKDWSGCSLSISYDSDYVSSYAATRAREFAQQKQKKLEQENLSFHEKDTKKLKEKFKSFI